MDYQEMPQEVPPDWYNLFDESTADHSPPTGKMDRYGQPLAEVKPAKDGYAPVKKIEPWNSVSLYELSQMEFPPEDFVIEGLFTPGVNLINADPKAGKTILAMDGVLHISFGLEYWGRKTIKGRCLYLALEDNYRRFYKRLMAMRPAVKDFKDVPLDVVLRSERAAEGLEQQLDLYMEKYPDTRVVVMDIYDEVSAQSIGDNAMNARERDRARMKPFLDMRDKYPQIAIIIVHHNRKTESVSGIHSVSGSQGIAGAADNVIIIKKVKGERNRVQVELNGRDLSDEYPKDFYMKHNEERLGWVFAGKITQEELVGKGDKFDKENKNMSAEAREFVNETFMDRKWITCNEFDDSARAVHPDISHTIWGRARRSAGVKCDKSRMIYHIADQAPTKQEWELYLQSRAEQVGMDEWQELSAEEMESLPFK